MGCVEVAVGSLFRFRVHLLLKPGGMDIKALLIASSCITRQFFVVAGLCFLRLGDNLRNTLRFRVHV